jgi:hypothetical protein
MPLSMPTKAAMPTATGLEYHAAAAPPSALSNASQNSRRRLPRRSPAKVTSKAASVAPARPALIIRPI